MFNPFARFVRDFESQVADLEEMSFIIRGISEEVYDLIDEVQMFGNDKQLKSLKKAFKRFLKNPIKHQATMQKFLGDLYISLKPTDQKMMKAEFDSKFLEEQATVAIEQLMEIKAVKDADEVAFLANKVLYSHSQQDLEAFQMLMDKLEEKYL